MATPSAVKDLIDQIKGEDEDIRAKAWKYAYVAGPAALRALAENVEGTELEVGRAAKRAMWKIVRHAGRPGADTERQQAVDELLKLLKPGLPRAVLVEVMWMLSEIGGDESVNPVASHLMNKELREDARLVLERLPGDRSLGVLKAMLKTGPDDFKSNIAQSLRRRGIEVDEPPCVKLKPTKQTEVKPVGR